MHASQIAVGDENNLNIRIYGEKGGLEWRQQEPNSMILKWLEEPMQIYRTGMGYLGEAASNASRTPAGHPEGYLEAFANTYLNFISQIREFQKGNKEIKFEYPTIADGVRGMKFIDAVVGSSKNNAAWTAL